MTTGKHNKEVSQAILTLYHSLDIYKEPGKVKQESEFLQATGRARGIREPGRDPVKDLGLSASK